VNRRLSVLAAILASCTAAAAAFAADDEKPLDWRELITVAQSRPTTDLQWGTDKAQILGRHSHFHEVLSPFPRGQKRLAADVTDGACSFVVHANFERSAALSGLSLELPRTAPSDCGRKWLAALQRLYGKPFSSGPIADIAVDADTAIQTVWRTPTSCITSMYTAAGAPHPGPFIVAFGDARIGACGYDDPVSVGKRRAK
jgi:hypothetical protein